LEASFSAVVVRRLWAYPGRVEIPVFPLPSVVLFPYTLLPLHIFEPRYRAMTAWCLEHDQPMAVGRMGRLMGAGRVVRHECMPDGRYNIVLAGEQRVRLFEELPVREGYRVFRAETVADEGDDGGQLAAIRALCATLALRSERVAQFVDGVLQREDPGEIADRLAAGLQDVEHQQRLLECTRVDQRLESLVEELAGLV